MMLILREIKRWIKRWILSESIPFDEEVFFDNAVRHSWNNILRPLASIIELENIKILDIGCGYGGALEIFKDGNQITGIELNISRARFAKNYFETAENIEIMNADIFECHLKDNSYDLIIAGDVFEHISDPFKLLELINSSLKPGGICFASFTPYSGIYGGHIELYLPIPYIHLLLPNTLVTKIITKLGDYNSVITASFVIEQFLALNKLTIKEFKQKLINLKIVEEWKKKNLGIVYQYSCILSKDAN